MPGNARHRGHDLADRPALERRADLKRRHVGLGVVHPPAHVRVDRHERVAHEQLARAGVRQLDLGQLEVRGLGLADRPGGQPDLAAEQSPVDARQRLSYAGRLLLVLDLDRESGLDLYAAGHLGDLDELAADPRNWAPTGSGAGKRTRSSP